MKRKRFFSLFSLFVCFSLVVLGFVGLVSAADRTLVISHDGNGIIEMVYVTDASYYVLAGSYVIPDGTHFWMYAVPNSGYVFDHWNWTGPSTGTTKVYPLTGVVASNFNVEAHFRLATDTVYLDLVKTSGGHAFLIDGFDTYNFDEDHFVGVALNAQVTIAIEPTAGWAYDHTAVIGSGANNGNYYGGSFDLVCDTNYSVAVYFVPIGATLAPTLNPTVNPSGGSAVPALPANFITVVEAVVIVFALPFMVIVGAPKLGVAGFLVMMCVGVGAGVAMGILPFFMIIFVGLGIGLMFFSLANRV